MDYSRSFADVQDIRIKGPVTFFFKIDPLVRLTSILSSRQWIAGFGWAMGLLAFTIVFGRFFCSFV
ncbi:MAG: hypothetical protein ACKVE4_01065 [Dissulfuribacterales bacterium]